MPNRPSHLNPEDFLFLSSVAGNELMKASAIEDEVNAHFEIGRRLRRRGLGLRGRHPRRATPLRQRHRLEADPLEDQGHRARGAGPRPQGPPRLDCGRAQGPGRGPRRSDQPARSGVSGRESGPIRPHSTDNRTLLLLQSFRKV